MDPENTQRMINKYYQNQAEETEALIEKLKLEGILNRNDKGRAQKIRNFIGLKHKIDRTMPSLPARFTANMEGNPSEKYRRRIIRRTINKYNNSKAYNNIKVNNENENEVDKLLRIRGLQSILDDAEKKALIMGDDKMLARIDELRRKIVNYTTGYKLTAEEENELARYLGTNGGKRKTRKARKSSKKSRKHRK